MSKIVGYCVSIMFLVVFVIPLFVEVPVWYVSMESFFVAFLIIGSAIAGVAVCYAITQTDDPFPSTINPTDEVISWITTFIMTALLISNNFPIWAAIYLIIILINKFLSSVWKKKGLKNHLTPSNISV
jgi:hypothetical protein